MTGKRFTIDEEGNITDTETDRTLYVENKYTECNYFLKLLNQLSEENEKLKAQLKDCEYRITDKEVEWLRENTVWEVMPSSHRTSTTYYRRNDE